MSNGIGWSGGRMSIVVLALAIVGCTDRPVATSVSGPPVSAPTTSTAPNSFSLTWLVGNAPERGAPAVDSNLTEPWGIAFGRTGTLWVANYTSGTSTLYDPNGSPRSRVVTIGNDSPTGIVANLSNDFIIEGGPASFLFAGEYGHVSGWNASSNSARLVIDHSADGAFYKGIAVASVANASRLYVTNFTQARVEVYDASFGYLKSFTDPTLPPGYAPFGIQNVSGNLLVTFAKQLGPENEDDDPAAGNGYVDLFNADGVLLNRFASRGTLNSPWGIAVAPEGFGPYAGDILVGNFGDGRIGVYDQNGKYLDLLRYADQTPISIGGLWGIAFQPNGIPALYVTACPDGNKTGLIGVLVPKLTRE